MRSPLAALSVTLTLALAGCTSAPEPGGGPAEAPAEVVATFYPLAFLAERIASPELGVASLVPPGVAPHDWEPGPKTRAGLEQARAFIHLGAGFEPWTEALLPDLEAAGVTVIEAGTGAEFRQVDPDRLHAEEDPDHAGEQDSDQAGAGGTVPDPHVWLDPMRARSMVSAILTGLVQEAPLHGLLFRERAETLRAELAALDGEFRTGLADCATRDILVTHAAFGYVALRYNLTVHSVSGLSPDAEPSPRRIAELADLAERLGLEVVFFERLVSPRVAEAIAREAGARTMVLDPVEGLTPGGAEAGADYFTLMRENLANLRTAMRCT